MLSVLIPVYNYPISALVSDLYKSCEKSQLEFEILVFEDGSTKFLEENLSVTQLPKVKYTQLKQNIGRSSIRNLLAVESLYPNLLFLDGDSGIVDDDFISRYKPYMGKDMVILGGRIYRLEDKRKDNSLLFKYGTTREVNEGVNLEVRKRIPVFTSPNFLITKENFLKVKFDESFSQYGHEDSIFGINLHRNKIAYTYIHNPIYHLDLEPNSLFLEKSEKALASLLNLYLSGNFPEITSYSKILQILEFLIKYRLIYLFVLKFSMFSKLMRQNLMSDKPSLFLFDLYKLVYICKIYTKG